LLKSIIKKYIHHNIPPNLFWRFCHIFLNKKSNYLFENSLKGYKKIYDEILINSKFDVLLHIGCNTGDYGNYLSQKFKKKKVILNDINSKLFKYHNKLSSNFNFIEGDILKIEIPKADIVICHTVLIYFKKDNFLKFINKVLDTNFSKLYLYEYFDNTYKYDFDNHINIHSSKILIEFFQNRDFVIQEVKLDKKNFSIFQSSYIKLYLIQKYR